MVDVETFRRKMTTDPEAPTFYERVVIDLTIEPKEDNAIDIGSETKRFRNVISAKSTLIPASAGADALIVRDAGNTVNRFRVTEDGDIDICGNIVPDADNIRDIGEATKRFKEAHIQKIASLKRIEGLTGSELAILSASGQNVRIKPQGTGILAMHGYGSITELLRLGLNNVTIVSPALLQPSVDNAVNIGKAGLRFKEIHAMKVKGHDSVVIPPDATASPEAGDMYFDAGTNTLYIYNGTAWVSVVLS